VRPLTVACLTTNLLPELPALPIGAWRAIKLLPESEILEFARVKLPGSDYLAIQARLARSEDFEAELDRLAEAGIQFLTEFDEEYPTLWRLKLGDKCPPHLFVAGTAELLNYMSVGVVGSRDVDPQGACFARDIGEQAAKLGFAVISGGAKGVDEIAMKAALGAGGQAIGILADSLARTMSKWDLESGQVCLATPFSPNTGFQVPNAMARNKLIYAGSRATAVASSALESGGTWAGAVEALKLSLCPVLVRGCGLPGNRALIERGGIAIRRASELDGLLETARPAQQGLF
jgi:predicted Rossmann fold nucleotide-binding protein DprA/Smf involved in DNA uptake